MHPYFTRFMMRPMLVSLVALESILGMSIVPVAANELVPPWQQIAQGSIFSSSVGQFAVAFPSEPVVSTEDDDIDGDPITIHEFKSSATNSDYMVAYADLPDAFLSLGADAVLNEMRDDLLSELELEFLASVEADVRLAEYPGRQYRLSGDEGTLDMRLYLVNERIYFLAAVDSNTTAVDRFINSFELR